MAYADVGGSVCIDKVGLEVGVWIGVDDEFDCGRGLVRMASNQE